MLEVLIDNRETELIKFFKGYKYITIKKLDLGDIIFKWNNDVLCIIERKSITDYAHSVKDGRFREQKMRLMSNYPKNKIIYLIEGCLDLPLAYEIENALPVATLYSSIYNMILRDNLQVYKTTGLDETKRFIKNLICKIDKQKMSFMEGYKQEDYHDANMKMKLGKKKDLNKEDCFMYQLCQVKGVSQAIAKAITTKFKSWKLLYLELEKYDSNDRSENENDFEKIQQIANIVVSVTPPKPLTAEEKASGKKFRKSKIRKVGSNVAGRIYMYMFKY